MEVQNGFIVPSYEVIAKNNEVTYITYLPQESTFAEFQNDPTLYTQYIDASKVWKEAFDLYGYTDVSFGMAVVASDTEEVIVYTKDGRLITYTDGIKVISNMEEGTNL